MKNKYVIILVLAFIIPLLAMISYKSHNNQTGTLDYTQIDNFSRDRFAILPINSAFYLNKALECVQGENRRAGIPIVSRINAAERWFLERAYTFCEMHKSFFDQEIGLRLITMLERSNPIPKEELINSNKNDLMRAYQNLKQDDKNPSFRNRGNGP